MWALPHGCGQALWMPSHHAPCLGVVCAACGLLPCLCRLSATFLLYRKLETR